MTYTVRDVVCDYGVYENYLDKDGEHHEDLKLICNSRNNALLIADIMEKDLKNEKYKIECEEAIEILKKFENDVSGLTFKEVCALDDAIQVLEKYMKEGK